MKRVLKIVAGVLAFLLVAAIALPFVFKDEIRHALDNEIRKRVDAQVYFGDFSVTMFRNFPNITVGLDKFGVVNNAPFKGDTLASVSRFNLVVDIWSVLFGDKYELKKVVMDEPRIHAKILSNGKANWDIMLPDSLVEAADTLTGDSGRTAFTIALSEYRIHNGYLLYDDRSSDVFLEVSGLDHSGKGNFSDKAYEFYTSTETPSATFRSGGTSWLRKGRLDIDLNMKIDNSTGTYTFMKNHFGLNELDLNLEGWVKMSGEDISMDLKYGTAQTAFRSVLSLVPGIYKENFRDLNTSGEFTLSGTVKGTYNRSSLPGFTANLDVKNGYFQYPELPQAVSNIFANIKAEVAEGSSGAIHLEIPKLSADFGNNPVSMRLNLDRKQTGSMTIDADMKATMNLEELAQMYPMEGQVLKGKFSIDASAKGNYDEAAGRFPVVKAKMALENGYLKSADFPSAMDKIAFSGEMQCANGSLAETLLDIKQLHAEIDGDPVDASFVVKDFGNPDYSMNLKANLDLAKLIRIYPMEGTTMSGKLLADIQTKGKYSDVEAGNYMNLPTSGSLALDHFVYSSYDLPQGLTIDNGRFTFSPQRISIDQYTGKAGRSPISLSGSLENYLAYTLMENQEIRGNMNLVSPFFDVNEWMSDAPAAEAQSASPAAPQDQELYVYEVPKGIDFVFNASIAKVFYDNLVLENLTGKVIMKDQAVRFEGLNFHSLGGKFALSGAYDTKDITRPSYDINFTLTGLQVKPVWENFMTVQALAPAGKFVNGIFNSTLRMTGLLKPDMMPDLTSISGLGDMQLFSAGVANFKVLEEIASKTKLEQLKSLVLNDQRILFEIKEGRFHVKPFDVKIGGSTLRVQGSNGFDKSLDYTLNMDIPAGQAGAAAASALSGLTGKTLSGTDKINLDLKLGGTIDNPKITGAGSSAANDLKEEAKAAVQEKVQEVKQEVQQQVQQKVEDTKQQVQQQAQQKLDEVKAAAEKAKQDAEAKAKAEADRLRQEAEAKKKAEEERLRKQAEEAKKKAEEEAKNKVKNIFKKP